MGCQRLYEWARQTLTRRPHRIQGRFSYAHSQANSLLITTRPTPVLLRVCLKGQFLPLVKGEINTTLSVNHRAPDRKSGSRSKIPILAPSPKPRDKPGMSRDKVVLVSPFARGRNWHFRQTLSESEKWGPPARPWAITGPSAITTSTQRTDSCRTRVRI